MSEIGKLIDRVAADALAAPLKAAGYRKNGRTWRRHLGGAVQPPDAHELLRWGRANGLIS